MTQNGMRILWLKSDLLLPLDKGGKLRTWHLMRHLAKRHRITYLSFADPDQIAADGIHPKPVVIAGMQEVAAQIEVVPKVDPPKGSFRFYTDAARYLLDPLPYAIAKYRSSQYAGRLKKLLAEEDFDLVVCDFLFPAVNISWPLRCPAVMFTHNVESEIWRRHAETATGTIGKYLYATQYRRMLRYEARTLAQFDGVLAVSDADRNTFARLYPGRIRGPVEVVRTGVDTAFFSPSPSAASSRRLVFTGSMDWLPNEDAMLFFCREILPRIRAEEPAATLDIVGRVPTPAVQRLADIPGVTVTGRVDDVRPYMKDASVYVVPLRVGGGTRLKIFEAMAMGRAVVSTAIGAEGLPVVHGRHLWLADDPQAFAQATIELLRNLPQRRQLESAARELVVEHYDWSAVAGELDDALTAISRMDLEPVARRMSTQRAQISIAALGGADLRVGPQTPVK